MRPAGQEGPASDVLFANAGIGEFCPPSARSAKSIYNKIFDINVSRALLTVRKVFAADERRRGNRPRPARSQGVKARFDNFGGAGLPRRRRSDPLLAAGPVT